MKRIIYVLMCLIVMGLSYAVLTNPSPATDVVTNENMYEFRVMSDDPLLRAFRVPTTYVELEIGGTNEMDCYLNATYYYCNLTKDISSLDGIHTITLTDNDGSVDTINMTIDHSVTANDFTFQATDNNVSYTDGCVDNISGIADSKAQYSDDNWTTTNNMTSNPQILPNATYRLKGYCKDNAGNEQYTGETSFTLPASPPRLTDITHLPSTGVCGVTYPCSYDMDGSGTFINASFRLTFDKDADITVSMDGGASVGSGGAYRQHVISFTNLYEGMHVVSIDASDGVNSENYILNLNVTNTGGSGSVTINVRGDIPVPPINESFIAFVGIPTVEKDNILPGDFAIVRYHLYLLRDGFMRFRFITSDSAWDTPQFFACEDNYDSVAQDIIDENLAFKVDELNQGYNLSKAAISCSGAGNLNDGLFVDVLAKYPIAIDADEGGITGDLEIETYNVSI